MFGLSFTLIQCLKILFKMWQLLQNTIVLFENERFVTLIFTLLLLIYYNLDYLHS